MREKVYPFFEVNGVVYKITPTRYLQTFFNDGMKRESDSIDQHSAARAFQFSEDLQKAAQKYTEARDSYFEDVTNEEKRLKYEAYQNAYLAAQDRLLDFEAQNRTIESSQKKVIDILEKTVIEAVRVQNKVELQEATRIWEAFADNIGNEAAAEWLGYFHECLFEQEEESPFLQMMREKHRGKEFRKK
jgi:hypothetical protein|nr:MAG TPA: hypothetical protein [Caudoviricetes sp.]